MADWQPREAVVRLAEEKGWDQRRTRIDDGCYEVRGRDAEGREIGVKLDPATLAVVEMELEDHECGRADAGARAKERDMKMAIAMLLAGTALAAVQAGMPGAMAACGPGADVIPVDDDEEDGRG